MTLSISDPDKNQANDDNATTLPSFKQHHKYWLEDGSIILRVHTDLYKVHRTLLHRHSKFLPSLGHSTTGPNEAVETIEGLVVVHIPDAMEVKSGDLEALLEHLYHDVPLDDSSSFPRVASLFRASSEQQLDFPSLHARARSRIEQLFSTGPETFLRPAAHAEEALALAVKYDIPSIRKSLYYSVATHSHPDPHEADTNPTAPYPALSPELAQRCDSLLEQLVSHFAPILFTVATAGHMACTDIFAEKWMPLVIQRALDDNGLSRPLETLEWIITIDWAAEGLCEECVKEKREEWRGEQRVVWEKLDEWLN